MPILVPQLSGAEPYNFGVAETYSYIPIANDQGRPIFAKASYITNLNDLSISLQAGNLDIGSVHIEDSNNNLYASIADVGLTGLDSGKGAIRVLTQDFDSNVDDITIGDKNGNFASVNPSVSALNVFVTNSVSAVSITNLHSVFDAVTANQASQITLANALTAKSNASVVTNWDVLSSAAVSASFTQLPSNAASNITILNTSGDILFIMNSAKTIPLPLPNNLSFDIDLVGNTNEVSIRSNSQSVTVYGTFTLIS
jgi:hypothetical protein